MLAKGEIDWNATQCRATDCRGGESIGRPGNGQPAAAISRLMAWHRAEYLNDHETLRHDPVGWNWQSAGNRRPWRRSGWIRGEQVGYALREGRAPVCLRLFCGEVSGPGNEE